MSKIHIYYANITDKEAVLPEPFLSKFNNSGCTSRKNEIASSYLLLSRIKDLDLSTLRYDENGKPFILDKCISISHDEEIVVIAVSDENLGVDILSLDKNYDLLQKSFDVSNKEEFVKTWVVMESYMKYLGLGLKAGYKNIRVDLLDNVVFYKGELVDVEFITTKIDNHYLGLLANSIDEVIFDKIEL